MSTRDSNTTTSPTSIAHELLLRTDSAGITHVLRLACQQVDQTWFGLTKVQFCTAIGIHFYSDNEVIRGYAIRLLRRSYNRHLLLTAFGRFHLDYIIARALITVECREEHSEALKFVFNLVQKDDVSIPSSLCSSLVAMVLDSIPKSSSGNGNVTGNLSHVAWRSQQLRNVKPMETIPKELYLIILCEMVLKHSKDMVDTSVADTLVEYVANSSDLSIIEAITLSVLACMEQIPIDELVEKRNVLSDLTVAVTQKVIMKSEIGSYSQSYNQRRAEYACLNSLKLMTRSWTGRFFMLFDKCSIIRKICDTLYCGNPDKQGFALRILYELLDMNYPENFTTFKDMAEITTASPLSTFPIEFDSMNVHSRTEWFIAGEGYWSIPDRLNDRLIIDECNQAFFLQMMITAGFLEKSSDLLIKGPDNLFGPALLLLAEFQHQCETLLSFDLNFLLLPTLVTVASTSNNLLNRSRASDSIQHISEYTEIKQATLGRRSVFLNHFLAIHGGVNASAVNDETEAFILVQPPSTNPSYPSQGRRRATSGSDKLTKMIMLCQCHLDMKLWNWGRIYRYLKVLTGDRTRVEEHVKFLQKVLEAFKFSGDKGVACLPKDLAIVPDCMATGIQLVDLICEYNIKTLMLELDKLVEEYKSYLQILLESDGMGHQSAFSDCRIYYLAFVGKLSAHEPYQKMVSDIIQILLQFIDKGEFFDNYLVMAASSLCLSYEKSRMLFHRIINSNRALRMYGTGLLRLLVRQRWKKQLDWITDNLLDGLADNDEDICLLTAEVMDEILEEEEFCTNMVERRLQFPARYGEYLEARLVGHERIFEEFRLVGRIDKMIQRWNDILIYDYVRQIEEEMMQYYSLRRTVIIDGVSRLMTSKWKLKKLTVPPHLYHELCKHEAGYDLVKKQEPFNEAIRLILESQDNATVDVFKLKTALWIVGNIGSTEIGARHIIRFSIIPHVIKIAEESSLIDLRATAYFAANLMAKTYQSARKLYECDWRCQMRNKVCTITPSYFQLSLDAGNFLPSKNTPSSHDCSNDVIRLDRTHWIDRGFTKKPLRCETNDSGIASLRADSNFNPVSGSFSNCVVLSNPSGILRNMIHFPGLLSFFGQITNELREMLEAFGGGEKRLALYTSQFLFIEDQHMLASYREVMGFFNHDVFVLWVTMINNILASGGCDDPFKVKCNCKNNNSANLKGLCLPSNAGMLLCYVQPSFLLASELEAHDRTMTNTSKSSEFVEIDQVEPNDVATNIFMRGVHNFLTGVTFRTSKGIILNYQRENQQTFHQLWLFNKICEAIANIRSGLKERMFLYSLFKDLDISVLRQRAFKIAEELEAATEKTEDCRKL